MTKSPGDFFAKVCESLVRITCRTSAGTINATGFIVGRYKPAGNLSLLLATAEHTFQKMREDENVFWHLQRFNWKGEPEGDVQFTSNIEKLGSGPARVHRLFDLALLASPGMGFDPSPVPIIDPRCAIVPGGRVGWAGFPAFARKKVERPHPCYFEGVVSTVFDTVKNDQRLFYLVDGHGGKGVSGGPLWHFNDETGDYEVIGICSQYVPPDDVGLPGLVAFESINPLTAYIRSTPGLETRVNNAGAPPPGWLP